MHRTIRTLLVEDSPDFLRMIRAVLKNGFPDMKIEGARDGQEALHKLETCHTHLVFLDIQLPGESGLVLAKRIRRRYPEVIIVILTNHDLPEYREAAFQNGAQYFCSKETTKAQEIVGLAEKILADIRQLRGRSAPYLQIKD